MVRERRESGKYVHRGLLNDWELSKKVPKTPEEEAQPGRQPDRTVRAYYGVAGFTC